MPVYGITGMFVDPNNADDVRAHGLNERIGVKAFYDQLEFTYRLLKALGTERAISHQPSAISHQRKQNPRDASMSIPGVLADG